MSILIAGRLEARRLAFVILWPVGVLAVVDCARLVALYSRPLCLFTHACPFSKDFAHSFANLLATNSSPASTHTYPSFSQPSISPSDFLTHFLPPLTPKPPCHLQRHLLSSETCCFSRITHFTPFYCSNFLQCCWPDTWPKIGSFLLSRSQSKLGFSLFFMTRLIMSNVWPFFVCLPTPNIPGLSVCPKPLS